MLITALNGQNKIQKYQYNTEIKTQPSRLTADKFEKSFPQYNAIAFKGINGKGEVKQRGMMFHISSLPATRSLCGQFLDPETDQFVDFLKASKQTHWIMNPLTSLNIDLCPYNSSSRFGRNKYLINLNVLTTKEYGNLLNKSDLPDDIPAPSFTLDMLKRQKDPRFEKALKNFQKLPEESPLKIEYREFERENKKLWLDINSAFEAISSTKGEDWKKWPKSLKMFPERLEKKPNSNAKEFLSKSLQKEAINGKVLDSALNKFEQYKFEQFLYDKQFKEFNTNLNKKGIRLILDLAVGVNPNGIDVWANKDIFHLDKKFNPTKVSGSPPEPAYPYTQIWGHPLYNYDSPKFWDYQEKSLKKLLQEGDVRLDHFVGYINRAEIPTSYTKTDGKVLKGDNIFKSQKEGGMGADFFEPHWIQRIDEKRNSRGENMFELFVRTAKESNLKPEDCYILEDFGPLAETPAYKDFKAQYGEQFASQRVPIAMGIGERNEVFKEMNEFSNPYNINAQKNVAILTGNHDLPPLRDYVDKLLDEKPIQNKDGKNSPALFREFCQKELKLSTEEIKNHDLVHKELMKWHYTRKAKQVQTTLQDSLGINYRPNIPGFWNGSRDKFLQKTSTEALLPFWSKVFPKGFLNRVQEDGFNPGYAKKAGEYIKTMQKLFK